MITVAGIEANIGSMLYPFYCHPNFDVKWLNDSRGIVNEQFLEDNMPGVKLGDGESVDIIVSQPACGKYSSLNNGRDIDEDTCSNLTAVLAQIKELNPEIFIIENKPGILDEIDFIKKFPEHYIQLEWVGNYYYGNVQKNRDRLYIIGTKRKDWRFIPNEKEYTHTLSDLLKGLPEEDDEALEHVHEFKPLLKSYDPDLFWTKEEVLAKFKPGQMLTYIKRNGSETSRPGKKLTGPIFCHTLTGGQGLMRWDTGYLLTVREKARIQGFPDTFTFKALKDPHKALGKSMPQEFLQYLVKLLWDTYFNENLICETFSHSRLTKSDSKVTVKRALYETRQA